MHVIDVLTGLIHQALQTSQVLSFRETLYSMGLGITYFHETFGNRNKIERWFMELKNRTKRFHNNVNAKTLKSIEEIATAVAIVHNLVRTGRGEVILT
jgi:transposase-like protein